MSRGRMQAGEPTRQKPLRLRPGVVAVMLQWLAWLGVPLVVNGPVAGYISVLGGFLGGLAVIVWWGFLSRAPALERWGAVAVMIAALVGTSHIIHESIATGMMGMMFFVYAIPVVSLAFVAWAVASRHLADGPRRLAMVATIVVTSGALTLLRSDGITGDGAAEFAWRWAETREEQLLANVRDEPVPLLLDLTAGEAGADWPGFRGPDRDGVIHGVRIETDWAAAPPVELWRRPVGPGISSFAVGGNLLYTQEQRGEDEVVASYDVATGKPVWRHRDAARFWDSHAGAGPRATPTLGDGSVYAFGATGILNALNAASGVVAWSRNAASDLNANVPGWGFASSPLVVDDLVIVAVAGALAAYDRATGDLRWSVLSNSDGYSSPHLLTIDGVAQVLLMNGSGATSVTPAAGQPLWEHAWSQGTRILQPALATGGEVLISAGDGTGVRRLGVSHGPGGWALTERWSSIRLKPYFSDFVVHDGHAFGFDGRILACIDVADGERKWKGGRFGHGQLVLLADQDLLLVVSEQGEVALVAATPERFTELARFPAIEGKTWNHPALVGDVLLLRNGQEMAAFRLSLLGS